MYNEIVNSLDSISQFASSTGLERGRQLLHDMNNPEKSLKIIHVAGTNGKGSVCAYIAGILQHNGYKTGLFTSPHLDDITERIRINGIMISQEDFEEAYWYVEEHRTQELAYFDYLFGMAMYYYSKHDVDYVVMETGLGGKLDATNAVDNPVVSVITTISLEHTAILGDTIEKIANEKAGIIKPGIPVVCSGIVKEAADVIRKRAADFGCDCHVVDDNTFELIQNTYGYIDFLIHNEYYKNDCFRLSTNALYQMENASIALTVCANLCDRGMIKLDNKAVSMAMYDTHWAGRMELLRDNLYVDGAHNPGAIEAFAESVKLINREKKEEPIVIFSAVSDKKYEQMIKYLCEHVPAKTYIVTEIEDQRRVPAEELGRVFRQFTKREVLVRTDLKDAIETAFAVRGDSEIYCLGSLNLVEKVKKLLEGC